MWVFYYIQRNYAKEALVDQDQGFLFVLTAFSTMILETLFSGAEGTGSAWDRFQPGPHLYLPNVLHIFAHFPF